MFTSLELTNGSYPRLLGMDIFTSLKLTFFVLLQRSSPPLSSNDGHEEMFEDQL